MPTANRCGAVLSNGQRADATVTAVSCGGAHPNDAKVGVTACPERSTVSCDAADCDAGPRNLRPRQDSNLRTRLRRPMLYPLSYEGI